MISSVRRSIFPVYLIWYFSLDNLKENCIIIWIIINNKPVKSFYTTIPDLVKIDFFE